MNVIVAGPGCPRCRETLNRVYKACTELNFPANVEHLTDIGKMKEMGIFMTPALLINGKIIFQGKIPTINEIKLAILKEKNFSEAKKE